MVTLSQEEYIRIKERQEKSRANSLGITPESIVKEKICTNEIVINYRPFPAVRSNRNTWTESVKKYHNHMNELRDEIGNRMEGLRDMLKSSDCEVLFIFAIPESYSNKKAQETQLKPYLQKPDTDNLWKAFTDTCFYKKDDKEVYRICAEKRYGAIGETSKIIVSIKKSKNLLTHEK